MKGQPIHDLIHIRVTKCAVIVFSEGLSSNGDRARIIQSLMKVPIAVKIRVKYFNRGNIGNFRIDIVFAIHVQLVPK